MTTIPFLRLNYTFAASRQDFLVGFSVIWVTDLIVFPFKIVDLFVCRTIKIPFLGLFIRIQILLPQLIVQFLRNNYAVANLSTHTTAYTKQPNKTQKQTNS